MSNRNFIRKVMKEVSKKRKIEKKKTGLTKKEKLDKYYSEHVDKNGVHTNDGFSVETTRKHIKPDLSED